MPNIYTRGGDRGQTGLFGGSRVPKQAPMVEAYGTVDEANSTIGQAKLWVSPDYHDILHQIQNRLFTLAAELASDELGKARLGGLVDQADVDGLEDLIDSCLELTGPATHFVIPGRDQASACLHQARTVVRRAERQVLRLAETEAVRPEVIRYLNRLSDALYAIARVEEDKADRRQIEQIVRQAVARVLSGATGSTNTTDVASPTDVASIAEAVRTATGAAGLARSAPGTTDPNHSVTTTPDPARTATGTSGPALTPGETDPDRASTPVSPVQPSAFLDLNLAKELSLAAEAKAAEMGVSIVFAAVDAGGNLILVHRMADSLLASIDIAINKAFTAAALKAATAGLREPAGVDGPLYGIETSNQGRLILFGGGLPVFCQGMISGGIGVSGGSVEEDVLIITHAFDHVVRS